MRPVVDGSRVLALLAALGREADEEVRVYLTGGTTAVLVGWRPTTVDIDLILVPDRGRPHIAIPRLKEELQVNIEQACPAHFIPELPGWEGRSLFVAREGKLTAYHYDPYSQVLAKIERGLEKDLLDVQAFVARGLVRPDRLRELFADIEPRLGERYAIDAKSFRENVDALFPPAGGFTP